MVLTKRPKWRAMLWTFLFRTTSRWFALHLSYTGEKRVYITALLFPETERKHHLYNSKTKSFISTRPGLTIRNLQYATHKAHLPYCLAASHRCPPSTCRIWCPRRFKWAQNHELVLWHIHWQPLVQQRSENTYISREVPSFKKRGTDCDGGDCSCDRGKGLCWADLN
jgi:hypothetical protein